MHHATITIEDRAGVLRHRSAHFDEEEGWDLPAGTYHLVPTVEGERSIHLTTVDGEWPFPVTQEISAAMGRFAAKREGWWRGSIVGDLLDLLAEVSDGSG